uniref:Uncharacterized protein n=1 Tax=Cacopsylla melanoneura TaxID=428564 RepID=A0A8D8XTG7_9HEMI
MTGERVARFRHILRRKISTSTTITVVTITWTTRLILRHGQMLFTILLGLRGRHFVFQRHPAAILCRQRVETVVIIIVLVHILRMRDGHLCFVQISAIGWDFVHRDAGTLCIVPPGHVVVVIIQVPILTTNVRSARVALVPRHVGCICGGVSIVVMFVVTTGDLTIKRVLLFNKQLEKTKVRLMRRCSGVFLGVWRCVLII